MVHADTEPTLAYTVQRSDKLIRLSRDMLVSPAAWSEVVKLNGLKDPDVIRPGQKLNIPLRLLRSQAAPAKLLSASGDVQVGGVPVAAGAAIAEGSKVQTGANSSAVVELGDGSQIKLLPGSISEVVNNRNYAMKDAGASASTTWFSGLIRLAQGSLEALASKTTRRAEPLRIQTQTSTLGVRGTQFRVALDAATGNPRSEVVEGLVRADNNAQQSAADLPAGSGAVIDPKVKEIKVVPLLPAPVLEAGNSELFKPQAALAWSSVAGASGYRVQVAGDAGFDKIVREYLVPSTNANLADLVSGSWYARVRGIDGKGIEGFDSVRLVAVRDARPVVVPKWEATNARLSAVDGKTLLTWMPLSANGQALQASGFSAEVATDAAFAQITQRAVAVQSSLSLGDLKAGVPYFVRINATLEAGRNLGSETYSFELPLNWGATVLEAASALRKLP